MALSPIGTHESRNQEVKAEVAPNSSQQCVLWEIQDWRSWSYKKTLQRGHSKDAIELQVMAHKGTLDTLCLGTKM